MQPFIVGIRFSPIGKTYHFDSRGLKNLKVGEHELVAVFTGKGPQVRDYRRGATISFDKGIGAKYVELAISDRVSKQQPEFVIREWE